ncbi:MAG: hypothetical protein ACREK8_01735 [Gemmatimonadales bacterium]
MKPVVVDRHLYGALIASLLATACQRHPTPLSADQQRLIVDSVQTMLTGWRDALDARNFTLAAKYYSNDPAFRWFEDGELKYRSGREIGDAMTAMAPAYREFTLSLIEPEITALAPGIAAVTTNFAQKMTDTTGRTVGFAGALSFTGCTVIQDGSF